jgi:hypothetical protein
MRPVPPRHYNLFIVELGAFVYPLLRRPGFPTSSQPVQLPKHFLAPIRLFVPIILSERYLSHRAPALLYCLQVALIFAIPLRCGPSSYAIHRSAWNRNSANFAYSRFSEVRKESFKTSSFRGYACPVEEYDVIVTWSTDRRVRA